MKLTLAMIVLALGAMIALADDAGLPPRDARALDAAVVESAPLDAGAIDAARPRPRPRARDAGVTAGAPGDAGIGDAGILDDAGLIDDAGLDDAGVVVDAAPPVDAGVPDAAPPQTVDSIEDLGALPPSDPVTHEPIKPSEPVTTATTTESTFFVIKVIGGLIALLVLAYLGGHRRVVGFQERLGISGVITAGFPFIALGVIASLPSVGILTGGVIDNLRPVLSFGLGWLGFIIGAQLDIRVLERVPRGTAYMILIESILPFLTTAGACGAIMIVAFGSSWTDLSMWRDVVILGAAAAMTAPRRFRGFANRAWREGRGPDVLLAQLDELVGVIGLLFITAYFRESTTAWQLPDTAWVFVSLGLGVTVGVLIFVMVRVPTSNAEFLAIVLGGIAFAAGFAGYLRLSPIVVCFIAGVLVTNFPNDQRDNVFRILRHLERPVHLMFLIVAGAVWSVADWRGWLLVPVFVFARVLGKWLGIIASRATIDDVDGSRTLVTPLSVLSIALVISADHTTFGSRSLAWVVTAVIGGALVTEILVQTTRGDEIADDPAPHESIDELDAASGPVYRDEEDHP